MVEKDFSRIGELFYKEVGEEEQVSLEGFIKKALTVYAQKFLNKEPSEPASKKIIFPCSNGSFSFTVKPYYGMPELSHLEITNKIYDVKKLLHVLAGDVTAEFSGLDLSKFDAGIGKKVLKSKKKDYSQIGDASFYFSLDPKTPDLLKKIVWKRVKSMVFDEEVFYKEEKDEHTTHIASLADRIKIDHSFYIDNNPTMGLVKEYCDVKQPSKGNCIFTYSISNANDKALPASILKHLSNVFELVRQDFDNLSYHRMKIEDVNNGFIGDYA
ncbi:MAG: hypothetical protein Q8O03_08185 [Nanoarchaeota archaeon]|nr:hypothetical protein [Nanoarchaeota archaeon]